jgi:hypothetical protein
MNKIATYIAPAAAALMLLASSAAPAQAAPYYNLKIKCQANDREGRVIPTRIGNADLGWNHFSGKHNIRKCDLLNIPIGGNVDKVDGHNLQYWGWASNRAYGRVKIIVKARYARKTDDNVYDSEKGNVIGVITAYCQGFAKCPKWVNE